jgi:AcrR family transcriptional regulator
MTTATPEITAFKRGPGGRPTRAEAERRHAALLETALRLFLEHGFDPVTIDEIARRSGVAKRFIYARHPDKSAIFVAAIERAFNERAELLQAFAPSGKGVENDLLRFGQRIIEIAVTPETLAVHRLFISIAPRFPQLAKLFFERNRHRFSDEGVRVLRFYAQRGEIALREPQLTAEAFFIAILGIPQRLALFGIREPPARERQRLRTAVRLFLDGCRTRKERTRRKA